MNPLTVIPAKYRQYVYLAYTLAVVVAGALAVAGVNTGKTNDVLAYLGAALGLTAASNVKPRAAKQPQHPGQQPNPFDVGH